MSAPAIPFYRPDFGPELRERIAVGIDQVLAGGRLMPGPFAADFEAQFRERTGCGHAVSVNSATTGLQIALQHFGAAGHEVLVPAASFITDVSAVMFAGGTPVLVDIDPETLALDLEDMERKLSSRTKGVIWVHLTGIISPDALAIVDFCKERSLFLIEDASQAHGASRDSRQAGSFGDVGVFSFYPTKPVTAGTGGIMTTDDPDLARFASEMRLFGKTATGEIAHLGNDWFLDEIRACVGFHHASDLDRQLVGRRVIAEIYQNRLRNQPRIRLLDIARLGEPSWYHFTTFTGNESDRDALQKSLRSQGIETKPIYRPVHHEQVFRHLDTGSLRNAEMSLGCSLCLPMFSGLRPDDAERVCDVLTAELRG